MASPASFHSRPTTSLPPVEQQRPPPPPLPPFIFLPHVVGDIINQLLREELVHGHEGLLRVGGQLARVRNQGRVLDGKTSP